MIFHRTLGQILQNNIKEYLKNKGTGKYYAILNLRDLNILPMIKM